MAQPTAAEVVAAKRREGGHAAHDAGDGLAQLLGALASAAGSRMMRHGDMEATWRMVLYQRANDAAAVAAAATKVGSAAAALVSNTSAAGGPLTRFIDALKAPAQLLEPLPTQKPGAAGSAAAAAAAPAHGSGNMGSSSSNNSSRSTAGTRAVAHEDVAERMQLVLAWLNVLASNDCPHALRDLTALAVKARDVLQATKPDAVAKALVKKRNAMRDQLTRALARAREEAAAAADSAAAAAAVAKKAAKKAAESGGGSGSGSGAASEAAAQAKAYAVQVFAAKSAALRKVEEAERALAAGPQAPLEQSQQLGKRARD